MPLIPIAFITSLLFPRLLVVLSRETNLIRHSRSFFDHLENRAFKIFATLTFYSSTLGVVMIIARAFDDILGNVGVSNCSFFFIFDEPSPWMLKFAMRLCLGNRCTVRERRVWRKTMQVSCASGWYRRYVVSWRSTARIWQRTSDRPSTSPRVPYHRVLQPAAVACYDSYNSSPSDVVYGQLKVTLSKLKENLYRARAIHTRYVCVHDKPVYLLYFLLYRSSLFFFSLLKPTQSRPTWFRH